MSRATCQGLPDNLGVALLPDPQLHPGQANSGSNGAGALLSTQLPTGSLQPPEGAVPAAPGYPDLTGPAGLTWFSLTRYLVKTGRSQYNTNSSRWRDCAPRGHWAMPGDICGLPVGNTPGTKWAEDGGAAQAPHSAQDGPHRE